jgi:hypothetical protein
VIDRHGLVCVCVCVCLNATHACPPHPHPHTHALTECLCYYCTTLTLFAPVIAVALFTPPCMHTTLLLCVQYRLGWGIPFINRVRDFSINGVDYDDLPDRILVGTSSFIAPYVHGREGDEERG